MGSHRTGGAFGPLFFCFFPPEVTTLNQPRVSYSHFKGLIFDWDGVIADTQLDFEPIRARFFNGRSVPLIEGLNSLSPEMAQQACEAIEAEEYRGASEATAVPGALDLLRWLDEQNIPWCVMSRNNLSSLKLAARAIGLDLPDITITRDSPFIKPDPRSMTDAARRLGVTPSQCLAVGDFVFELLAARRASMRVVLVERSGAPWEDLADAVYRRMTDFATAFIGGDSFVPWEYHRFDQNRKAEQFFDLSTSSGWQSLDELLASGVTELNLPSRPLLSQEWRACPGFSPAFLHEPLFQVIQQVFAPRYPLLNVSPCQEEDS